VYYSKPVHKSHNCIATYHKNESYNHLLVASISTNEVIPQLLWFLRYTAIIINPCQSEQ